MTTAVVTIICIALVVVGGMTMSQGILTSADTTALSAEAISTREGDIMRTDVATIRAEELSWADCLRVTVANSGQTKLASFDKWDFIVQYHNGTNTYSIWLPYTEGTPANNEWEKARICLDGQTEVFEPGILNPQEELVILAKLNPLPGASTTGDVTIGTPNGVEDSATFYNSGATLLIPHSENRTLAGTGYHELAEGALADGAGLTETTDLFTANETNRKIMHDENDSSRQARHIFSLTGISSIPAATWTVYYQGRTLGFGTLGDKDANFNIDVLIRKADGTVRDIIATRAAKAYLTGDEVDTWVTKSATYDFLDYEVVDDTDYLEVVYYGETSGDGPGAAGQMQIRIDDTTLGLADQTRIEA